LECLIFCCSRLQNARLNEGYHLLDLLAEEFLEELLTKGRIYGYRFRPEGRIYGKPIEAYPGQTIEGKAFQVMIDNNLDFEIALYPYELVTYGETGRVMQNWMQYHLVKKYLQEMNEIAENIIFKTMLEPQIRQYNIVTLEAIIECVERDFDFHDDNEENSFSVIEINQLINDIKEYEALPLVYEILDEYIGN